MIDICKKHSFSQVKCVFLAFFKILKLHETLKVLHVKNIPFPRQNVCFQWFALFCLASNHKNDQHLQKTFIFPGKMYVFNGLDLFFDFETHK